MANSAALVQDLRPKSGLQKFWAKFKLDWQLHLMMLIPFLYILLFEYFPSYGLMIAFKEYSPRKGILGSEWIGLDNLRAFFSYYGWTNLVVNTVALSMYSLVITFPLPIILALIIHVYSGKTLKKVAQNISYIPHFISLVVMIGILNTVLNPVSGFLGYINKALGNLAYEDIRSSKEAFRHLYVWSGAWQGTGWGAIIYVSALSAVPDELHEAAKLDGASRLRRVFAVDLPTILPTVCIMLILRFGGIMSVGYEKAWLMQKAQNLDVSEIISTYVYKKGLQSGRFGFGTAVGLLNTGINTVLTLLVNGIVDALSDGEMSLF